MLVEKISNKSPTFGVRCSSNVLKTLKNQGNIPIAAKKRAIEVLCTVGSEHTLLDSMKFYTVREPYSHRHINCLDFNFKMQLPGFMKSFKSKVSHKFLSGDDRGKLPEYLAGIINNFEQSGLRNYFCKSVLGASNQEKKLKKMVVLYPEHTFFIKDLPKKDMFLY